MKNLMGLMTVGLVFSASSAFAQSPSVSDGVELRVEEWDIRAGALIVIMHLHNRGAEVRQCDFRLNTDAGHRDFEGEIIRPGESRTLTASIRTSLGNVDDLDAPSLAVLDENPSDRVVPPLCHGEVTEVVEAVVAPRGIRRSGESPICYESYSLRASSSVMGEGGYRRCPLASDRPAWMLRPMDDVYGELDSLFGPAPTAGSAN